MSENTTTPAQRAAARAQAATAATRTSNQRSSEPRERAKNFGGPRLKLSVPQTIEGYHLYWENDDEGAIEQLLYDGFEFVKPAEVRMQVVTVVADTDLNDRVSKFVGKKADGSPLSAYLLKCKEEVWKEREASRYQQADDWEDSIYQAQTAPGAGRYIPKGTETTIDPNYKPSQQ